MSNNLINRPVAIHSRSSNCWLDGRQDDGSNVLLSNRNPNEHANLQWMIQPCGQFYTIKSLSSNCYLDGRGETGQVALVTNRPPAYDQYLQWRIMETGEDGYVVFESVSSRCFLDGRGAPNADALVTNRNWRGDHFFYFKIHPIHLKGQPFISSKIQQPLMADQQYKISGQLINRRVCILSRTSKCWLDGRQDEGSNVLVTNRNPFRDDFYLQWIIQPCGKYYTIKSVSSNCYLDGRDRHGQVASVTNRPPGNDKYLQWRLIDSEDGYVIFQSVSSMCYLDGRADPDSDVVLTGVNWRGYGHFYFRIFPIS